MKINLDTQIKMNSTGAKTARLGDILEELLFRVNTEGGKELYDKITGKAEADLSVKERSSILDASKQQLQPGVHWQLEPIMDK